MAVEFEQITALIDANTTRWENKLNKMSTSFDKKAAAIEKRNDAMVAKMNSGWAKFGGGLNGVTAKLAGIFSTAAVVGFAKSILDTGDALQDASAQLGVTSQQLQALDYAARVSGASSDKLVQALSFLSDGLGEAQRGEGDMAKAMRASGIQMGTNIQVLYDIADKVKAATTETEKMNIATTYLGTKSGKSMVSFLNQGADGLRRLQEEATKKGQVWDADTLQRLDDAKDAFETFKKSLVNIAALPTSEFLTDLSHVLELLSGANWKQNLASLAKFGVEAVGGAIGGVAGSAAGPVGTVGGAAAGAAATTWIVHKLFPDAPIATPPASSSSSGSSGGDKRSNVPLSQAEKDKAMRDAEKALRDANQISEMLQRAYDDSTSANEEYLEAQRDATRATDQALLRRSADWSDAADVQKQVIDETAKLDIQSINARRDADLRALDERKKADIDRLTQLKASEAEIAEATAKYDSQKQDVVNAAQTRSVTIKINAEADKEDVPTIAKDLKNDVHTAFRDGVKAAIEGGDIKSVFANLADSFADRLSDKLGDELFDLTDRLLGSLFKSGSHGGFDSLFGAGNGIVHGESGGTPLNVWGSILGSIWPFAKGGIMTPNGPMKLRRFAAGGVSNGIGIFGEAGPEAAVPLPDGRRIPVDLRVPPAPRLPARAGASVSINIDARGAQAGVADQIDAKLRAAMPAILAAADRQNQAVFPIRLQKVQRDVF
jgi:hypothetical protein